MKKILFFLSIIIFASSLFAQMSEEDVRRRLEAVHNGKLDDVRAEIPSLARSYPNDAGVKYLDAYTTRDGTAAVKKYQSIVEQFPESDWADDALYRVYQYNYSVGLYKIADQAMLQLQKQYPNSIYAKRDGKLSSIQEVKPAQAQQPVPVEEPKQIVEKPVEQKIETPVSITQSTSSFVVQVGVFSTEGSALLQSKTFSGVVGREAIIFPKTSAGKQVYAVGFDGFENEQSARGFIVEIKSKYNIDAFLVKR